VSTAPVQLVWFKRDLRVRDHAPLLAAAAAGPVLPLYVYEPELLTADDHDGRHLALVHEALGDLDLALRRRGSALVTRVGRLPDVFERLRAEGVAIAAIHAHEETGNALSYARDRRVRRWAREVGIPLCEHRAGGVERRSPGRDGWAARWEHGLAAPPGPAPDRLPPVPAVASEGRLDGDALRARGIAVRPDTTAGRQPGGERAARALLASFLTERGTDYRRAMSFPVAAETACSRVSPHLALGVLSVRQVLHAARHREAALRALVQEGVPVDRRWFGALESFVARLHWRDHFIQKLEDEPALEHADACPAYAGLRDAAGPDAERLAAWTEGRTGYPFVDACLRSLATTGWLTFRLRAMLMSFAAYHLWLDWRAPSRVLARWFTDYEPGIHYSQCQMQAGTTGINTIRIYNPYLQHERLDPTSAFVRRWVPELAALPDDALVRPHDAPPLVLAMAGVTLGRDYPVPIVDHDTAYRAARTAMHERRSDPATRAAARAVYTRHGSRRQSAAQRGL
jgi:deoxyribodipyrimidine photo-lyase